MGEPTISCVTFVNTSTRCAADGTEPRYLDFNGVVHSCVNDWSLQEHEEFLFRLIEVGGNTQIWALR